MPCLVNASIGPNPCRTDYRYEGPFDHYKPQCAQISYKKLSPPSM